MTKLVTNLEESQVERIEPEDDRPAVGSWWWCKERKASNDLDRGRQWLACVIEVGSNYVKLQGVRYSLRLSIDELHARCIAEHNPNAFIDAKITEHKTQVRELMGEIQRVCRQIGVPMNAALAAAESTSQALATTSGVEDVKAYNKALVKAKDKTLPELFEKVKKQHEHLATWMKAELIPTQAELKQAKTVTERITDKIHTVELYAGLQEELVCVREGDPAEATERVRLMQRRCYMDEECLARYEAGGMDFKDIKAFDKWIARDENMWRILPHERCIVAFRVRRRDRQYGGEIDTLANFIKFWGYNEANKQTFLYIRNGHQLWRMATTIDFAEELFPRREDSDLLGDDDIYVKEQEHAREQFISGRAYASAVAEWHQQRRAFACKLWQWHNAGKPKDDWLYTAVENDRYGWEPGSQHAQTGKPDKRWDLDRPEYLNYKRLTPESIYYDDAMKAIARAAFEHNRIAIVVQGLLDRSTCLHPHAPWKLWTPEGFTTGIELVYDTSLAITPGDAPDWEGYRAQLNRSIRPGCYTIGQRSAWADAMKAIYGERDWRYHSKVGKGPHWIDRVAAMKPRTKECQFTFSRDRVKAVWVPADRPGYIKPSYPKIEMSWWCPFEHLTCIDAYTPGDFHMFFDDPRTRGNYLEWAPILLAAEDWHEKRRTAPDTINNDEED